MAKRPEIKLPSAADIFSTQEERDAEANGAIREIEISLMDSFPDHPYGIRDDEAMVELVSSISQVGIIDPLLLRPIGGGRFVIVSGHRRKHAAETLGIETLPAYIREMSDDEAIIAMTDANLQRPEILPSEKARAYKMKLEAMKRKAGRPTENGALVEHLLRGVKSIDVLADQVGESREQIRRYVRIADLIPGLLKLMDEGRMKMRPAVELSYLSQDDQEKVLECIGSEACTPSHDQARRIRKLSDSDGLTDSSVAAIMQESKPNQVEVVRISKSRISKLIPADATNYEIEQRIIRALETLLRFEQAKAAQQ